MADNITLNSGSGGSTAWTDEVTGSKHAQIVKLADGTADSTTVIASGNGVAAGALRVTLASDGTGIVALTTSTASIGKLAANSGVDIGDVDITSIIPGTGATNLGKAIDTALGATDTGVLALTVRDDALATLTEIDGDISALRVDSTGRLWCNVSNTVTVGSHAVTNAGTFAVQVDGSALTALQLIDDMIYADDGAWTGDSSKHGLVGGIYQSSPQTVTDGRTAPIQLTVNGYQIVTVNGTVTVGSHAVTNAGTFAVQVDGSALTALQLIDDTVYTDDAAFTPGTSKLLVIGAQADEDSSDAVDEGDAGALRMTLERKLRTVAALDSAAMQSGNDQVTPKFAVISAASSGDNTLVSAVASKKIRVLAYSFTANGTVTVRFESGAAGTALTGQMDFIVNTGISVPFSPVGHFETAANTLLNLELSGAVEVAGHLTYIEVD